MKIIFFSILTLYIQNIFALQWSIKKRKNIYILENKNGEFYQVINSGGTPKFIKEKKLNKKFTIVIYYSGTAGTSTPVKINRAVLFKGKELKYSGDFPYKHSGNSKQPSWIIKPNSITITDSESGLEKTID
jgi:hypothetical protein